MLGGHAQRSRSVVNGFLLLRTRDAMVLLTGERALSGARHVGFDVIVIQVKPDVPVEIAVMDVARIAFVFAPDLAGRFEVAAKGGDAIGGENGGEYPIARARPGVKQAVGVDDEPAEVRFLQRGLHSLDVGAFGQPDAARFATKTLRIMVAGDEDLGADRGRVTGQQRQHRMSGGACDDLQLSGFLEFAGGADQGPAISKVSGSEPTESR